MTQFIQEETMYDRMMAELRQQEELLFYKKIVISYINNAIEVLNVREAALDLLNGSLVSIHTAKTKEEVDFYVNNAEHFINSIQENLR
ncbi:hypothetical protein [Cytobacillus sp. NCCP-133]|uniref:hypothetical protein n=1 Tax=Cytobacillus sp. NCCP-133 TaxID=766848 RepID=UPI00223179D9|nr:hypothetical protein [Cytobacillus sp. NCCP-133]GLB58649.1 hypothetical protein NCCP133_07820 [Cytobacillus sp. NCCP-133]